MYSQVNKRFEAELEQAHYQDDVSLLAIGTLDLQTVALQRLKK